MQEKNRERKRYLRNSSATGGFVKKRATLKDLEVLDGLMKEQYVELKKSPAD